MWDKSCGSKPRAGTFQPTGKADGGGGQLRYSEVRRRSRQLDRVRLTPLLRCLSRAARLAIANCERDQTQATASCVPVPSRGTGRPARVVRTPVEGAARTVESSARGERAPPRSPCTGARAAAAVSFAIRLARGPHVIRRRRCGRTCPRRPNGPAPLGLQSGAGDGNPTHRKRLAIETKSIGCGRSAVVGVICVWKMPPHEPTPAYAPIGYEPLVAMTADTIARMPSGRVTISE